MLLFVIFDGLAVLYGAAYVWHSVKRKRLLGALGALLLALLGIFVGVLLCLYVM